MRKLFKVFLALTAGLAIASCAKEYDDTELKGKVDALDKKVSTLEQKVNALSEQVTGIAATIEEWKKGGFVESIQEIEGGYTINFVGGKTVTLYNGKDGKDGTNGTNGTNGNNGTDGVDGKTPQIISYNDELVWAIDGEPILVGGKPVPANVVPTFQIKEDGHLWMTLSGAETDLGKVVGEDGAGAAGDSILKSIEEKDGEVVFTLNGDPEVVYTIPMAKAFKLVIANKEYEAAAGATLKIDFTVTNGTAEMVDCFAGGLYSAKIVGSQVVVNVPDPFQAGQVLVWAQNDKGLTSLVKLSFIASADLVVVTPADEIAAIPSAAGDFEISLTSNVDVKVNEPTVDWVSAVITKAAYTLTLTLQENETGAPRETDIEVVRSDNDKLVQKIHIVQLYEAPAPLDPAKAGDILWAEDWSDVPTDKEKSEVADYTYAHTVVYGDRKVSYTAGNSTTSTSKTQLYYDTQYGYKDGEGAALKDGNILIAKGNGSLTVTGIPVAEAKAATLTFKVNAKRDVVVTSPTENVTIGERAWGAETSKPYSATIDITIGDGVEKIALVFTNVDANNNVRLDDIKLQVPEEATPKELTVERLWGKYPNTGWPTDYMTANFDRTSTTDGEWVYVAKANASEYGIVAISVSDPSVKKNVNVEGVDGGLFKTSCVRTIYDPDSKKYILLASSLTTEAGHLLKIYAWKDGIDAAPTTLLSWEVGGYRRFGDFFTVTGTWKDGELWFRNNTDNTDHRCDLCARFTVKNGALTAQWPDAFSLGYNGSKGMGSLYFYEKGKADVLLVTPDIGMFFDINNGPGGKEWSDGSDYSVYAKRFGITPFEFNGKKYIAYLHMYNAARGWLTILNDTQGTSEGFMQTIVDNSIYFQSAVQIEKDEPSTEVVSGATYSGNTMANCSVAVMEDHVIIVGHQQNTGLSVYKMYMK